MEVPLHSAKLGDYILGRKIGSGSSSKVREAFTKTGKVAIKYLSHNSNAYIDLISNEAKIMTQLEHPHIVKLYEYKSSGMIEKADGKRIPVIYLALELVTGGELFEHVALTGSFSENLARHYFKQLIEALEFIHSKGFAHRDIKAENILLDSQYALKLTDFGFATELTSNEGMLHTYKGTTGYMAPEIHIGQHYSGQKADLFAAGVLLFILVTQHPPFKKAVSQDAFYRTFCYENQKFWEGVTMNKPGAFSTELRALINSLLAFNPTLRPSIAEIKSHSWYNGPNITEEELRAEFRVRREKAESQRKAKLEKALQERRTKNNDLRQRAAVGELNLCTSLPTRKLLTAKEKPKQVLPLFKVIMSNKTIGYCV